MGKILVTGATGNVGKHVIASLLNMGETVLAGIMKMSEQKIAEVDRRAECVLFDFMDEATFPSGLC